MHPRSSARSSLLHLALRIMAATTLAACGATPASPPQPSLPAQVASPTPARTAASPTAAGSPTNEAVPSPIVGEWLGYHDCEHIKAMLEEAGLDDFVAESIYGNGLVPGVTSEEGAPDAENLCQGAVRREHTHFFTGDGRFGSRDYDRQQVDDGRYELAGDDMVVINSYAFGYLIDGDTLRLTPPQIDISNCSTKECRFPAAWVLMVALPGTSWTRLE